MESWSYTIEADGLRVELPLRLFPWDVIVAALYPFTDRCFVSPQLKDVETVSVVFEPKTKVAIALTDLVKDFSNRLIDQQLRFQLNHEFGAIRNAIVQRAFAPVAKSPRS